MKNLVKYLIIVALFAGTVYAGDCITAPCSGSTNFSFDLNSGNPYGEIQKNALTFYPPLGYTVRVLRLQGDFTAWVIAGLPTGASSGVLFGLTMVDPPTSSSKAYPLSDVCLLELQDVFIGVSRVRDTFNVDAVAGGLLSANNELYLTVASFMNTAGVKIHAEPTFVVTYRFERIL